ncbi:hypothetical protein [Streptomyces kaempferi]|uniref:Uncharacterized protein n=1 Tax=Streptomyces kaempferi TaxID=333725 RepID=A0ABW3XQX2_9ACTN
MVTSAPSHLQIITREKKNTRRPRQQIGARRAPRIPFTAGECQQAIALTEQVQRQVWSLFDVCSRRLAYALRPLIAAGWTGPQLTAEIATWGVPSNLKDPAAHTHHEIHRRQRLAELPPTPAEAVHAPCTDDGTRYEAMLRDRERHTPAWQRYTQQVRPQLRADMAELRERRRAQDAAATTVYRPVLRESEEAFLASLPPESWVDAPTPREIYAARAHRQAVGRGRMLPATDHAWQEHLRDHAAAAHACANLRVRWAREADLLRDAMAEGEAHGEDDCPAEESY